MPLPFLRLPDRSGFFVDKWLYHWDMAEATRRYGVESGLNVLLDSYPTDRTHHLVSGMRVVGDKIWITR